MGQKRMYYLKKMAKQFDAVYLGRRKILFSNNFIYYFTLQMKHCQLARLFEV